MEADIIINGVRLSEGQSMTLRVALNDFQSSLVLDGLGDDKYGKTMVGLYLNRSDEILKVMHPTPPEEQGEK